MDRFRLDTETKRFLEKLVGQLAAPIQAVSDAWKQTSAAITDGFTKQQQQLDALAKQAQDNALQIQSLTEQLAAASATGGATPDPGDVLALNDLATSIGGFAVPTPPAS